jgi:hypothetical protein
MTILSLTFDDIANANILVGDASVVSNWNNLFNLPTNGNPFTGVTINGNIVQLNGGSNITMLGTFDSNQNLLKFNDYGSIVKMGDNSFCQTPNISEITSTSCLELEYFEDIGALEGCTGLSTLYLPSLEVLVTGAIQSCSSLQFLYFPNLLEIQVSGSGGSMSGPISVLYTPKLQNLGATVGDDGVFNGFGGSSTVFTVNSEIMTCNSGNPDGDIDNLISNYSPTIVVQSPDPNAFNLVFDNISNANTLVGDASNVNDWNTFFDLPYFGNPFTGVTISGTTVQLFGGSNIKVKPGLMYDNSYNTFLISIVDNAGSITSVGGDAFSYCMGLVNVYLPSCTIVYGSKDSPLTDDYGGFGYCENLVNVNIPLLEYAGKYAFGESYKIQEINFPNLISCDEYSFSYLYDLSLINLPSIQNLGYNPSDNRIFQSINSNTINVTINQEVYQDSDLVNLSLNNNIIVNGQSYVPFTGYSGNLSIEFNNISNADSLVGDASDVNDWNTFFDLPTWSTPFTGVTVSGNTVILEGGENIIIRDYKFQYNTNIISVIDEGCVAYVGYGSFIGTSIESISFQNLKTTNNGTFQSCSNLTTIDLPQLITAGEYSFYACNSLQTINLPQLIYVSNGCFNSCASLTSINLPLCQYIGQDIGHNNVFDGINDKIILININNSLNNDGDLIDLAVHNIVILNETPFIP